MLTTKDMGVSGANSAQKFPGIGAIVNARSAPASPECRAMSPPLTAASIGLAPGYFRRPHARTHHDPFLTGEPSVPNFKVQNLNLAGGLTLDKLEIAARCSVISTRPVQTWKSTPQRRHWTKFGREAMEFVTGPTAREAFNIGKEDVKLRDRYGRNSWASPRSSPGELSKRAPLSSPSTSAAGIITGV